MRLDGPRIWVLHNDEVVLFSTDPAIAEGGVAFGVARLGDDADPDESAAVFRNLRLSLIVP
jgi:hypothetical protein